MDDAQIDALFRRAAASTPGPASPHGEDDAAGWDERADATLERALAERAGAAPADLDALLAAPALAPEPGEHDGSPASGGTSRAAPTSVPGVHDRNGRMSEENSKPPPSRRPSLKELAESVKNRPSSPGGPSSQRPPPSLKSTLVALDGKTPPPPAAGDSVPPPSRPAVVTSPLRGGAAAAPTSSPEPIAGPSSGPISGPTPSTPAPTSGPISAPMAVVPPSAKPTSAPATQPSAAGPGPAKSSSGTGKMVGVACFLAAAAAAAFALTRPAAPTATPAPMVAEATTAAPTAEPAAPAPAETAQGEPSQAEGVIDINQLADADAAASAAPAVGGPLPTGPAPSASAAAVAKNDPAKPAGPGEELGDAIRNRAGGGSDAPEDAEPAAGEPSTKNLPDVPPTGAVTSAINAVKGNAKGCVAGADEPSSATITFSSSGAVQSVTVGGWAQGKSAAGCIKSALQGARVPAFAKPTYATSVTIRP